MNSRDQILSQILKNKPEKVALPMVDQGLFKEDLDLKKEFIKMVEQVGGSVIMEKNMETVHQRLTSLFPKAKQRFSTVFLTEEFNNINPDQLWYPHELSSLDLLILEGVFGVAENGAIWLSEAEIPMRVMPFITKNLVLILNENKLVENMHEAYQSIAQDTSGYGLFISGPSKTADIEQSLVIGAQGSLSLHVILLSD
jgi:L-lactate dehydrogenase complex protein LldG